MATNGALSNSDLSSLTTAPGEQLEKNAASSWDRLQRAVKSEHGWSMQLNDSYRSLADQRTVFLSRYKPQRTGSGPFGDVRKYNGTRYVRVSAAGPAAIPGTSNHGDGRAVDVKGVGGFNSARYRQLNELAADHGWSNAEGRKIGEYWHWVHNSSKDKHKGNSKPKPVEVTVAQIKTLQRAVNTKDDGYWGKNTYHSVVALREASWWAGRKFPFGQKTTQRVVGRPQTGKWSGTDDKAHTETVKKLQRIFKVKDDGIWGGITEAKFQAFRRTAKAMNK